MLKGHALMARTALLAARMASSSLSVAGCSGARVTGVTAIGPGSSFAISGKGAASIGLVKRMSSMSSFEKLKDSLCLLRKVRPVGGFSLSANLSTAWITVVGIPGMGVNHRCTINCPVVRQKNLYKLCKLPVGLRQMAG